MGRLRHVKFDRYDKYLAADTSLPPRALLTTWDCLADFHDDLVLVGGLAVRFLSKSPAAGQPGPVTLDVDFAVSIAVDGGLGPTIRSALREQEFRWDAKELRFSRQMPGLTLYVDLLTDDGRSDKGTVMVDDGLPVSVMPGIDRALACVRVVPVTGTDLNGTTRTLAIKIAEVGPMLALKLNAFGGPEGRGAGKDAHDILHLVTRYLDGLPAAVAGFQVEKSAGNRAMLHALACLRRDFADVDAAGPVACADFRMPGWRDRTGDTEEAFVLRQQCVTLAQVLLA
jgi:hypothetical protein